MNPLFESLSESREPDAVSQTTNNSQAVVYGIFGTYRWFLATLVLLSHLGPLPIDGNDDFQIGCCALWAFFTLSGYTAAFILDNRYLDLAQGVQKYFINRALRVYPVYWAIVGLSIPLTISFPDIAKQLNGGMTLPTELGYWIPNVIIFGLASQIGYPMPHMLVPVAWSLAIEMEWWCIMPFIVRNSSRRTNFFRFAGLLALFLIITGPMPSAVYLSVLDGLIPFALGLALYSRLKTTRLSFTAPVAASGTLLIQVLFLWMLHAGMFYQRPFGFTLAATAASIYCLASIDAARLPLMLGRIDRLLGRLAYPVFLLNIVVGVLVRALFPALQFKTWGLFFASWLAAQIIGVMLFVLIEVPVERMRRHFKC